MRRKVGRLSNNDIEKWCNREAMFTNASHQFSDESIGMKRAKGIICELLINEPLNRLHHKGALWCKKMARKDQRQDVVVSGIRLLELLKTYLYIINGLCGALVSHHS